MNYRFVTLSHLKSSSKAARVRSQIQGHWNVCPKLLSAIVTDPKKIQCFFWLWTLPKIDQCQWNKWATKWVLESMQWHNGRQINPVLYSLLWIRISNDGDLIIRVDDFCERNDGNIQYFDSFHAINHSTLHYLDLIQPIMNSHRMNDWLFEWMTDNDSLEMTWFRIINETKLFLKSKQCRQS